MALEKRLADLQAGEATLKGNMRAFEEQRQKSLAQAAAQLEVNILQHADMHSKNDTIVQTLT